MTEATRPPAVRARKAIKLTKERKTREVTRGKRIRATKEIKETRAKRIKETKTRKSEQKVLKY